MIKNKISVAEAETTISLLNEIRNLIINIKSEVLNELNNVDINLVLPNEILLDSLSLKGLKYYEIEELIKAKMKQVDLKENLLLNRKLDAIKNCFCDMLVLDSSCSKVPKSNKVFELIQDLQQKVNSVQNLGKCSYFSQPMFVFSMKDIERLDSDVYGDLLILERFISNKRNEEWRRKKASHDFIKRNKK